MTNHEFQQEISSLQRRLYNFAYRLTSNVEDAEDLTQDTILNAWKSIHQFSGDSNFRSWIFTIMRNVYINQYNRKILKKEVSLNEEHVDIKMHTSDYRCPEFMLYMDDVTRILSPLDEDDRTTFIMHADGFKYSEIAEIMDIPIGTVKSKIFRVRKKLLSFIQTD